MSVKINPARESSIVEELAQHMEDRYQELLATSESGEAAERAVLSELSEGGLLAKELLLLQNEVVPAAPPEGDPAPGGLLMHLWQDVRYGLRTLRLNPGFACVALLSLTLGIGANTAIFQLLDAVLLRSLPVSRPGELMEINAPATKGRTGTFRGGPFSVTYPLWEQIRDHQEAFSGVFAWGNGGFDLSTGGQIRIARGMFVSGEFYHVLGVQPILGRVFSDADDQRGCGASPAVISHSFWQHEYGGDPQVIGRMVKLGGRPFEVIGVTPPDFYGMQVGRSFDVTVPLCAEPILRGEGSIINRRDGWWLGAMGRLKPGWTVEKATAQLEGISPGLTQATLPGSYNADAAKGYLAMRFAALPASGGISGLRTTYSSPLCLLLAIAGTVLLIACANLASLMFARAGAREHEIAVRLAIGASRARLTQQLLMESLLLSCIGALLGIGLAQGLSRILVSFFATQYNTVLLDLKPDWRVLGFTAGLALLTCVLSGLAPAIRAALTPPGAAMKAGGRGANTTRQRFGVRRILVVAQVALSLVLLVAAMLFVRTFQNLAFLDAGFQQNGILVAFMSTDNAGIAPVNRIAFRRDLLQRVREIPGVESAAESTTVPVSGNVWNEEVHTDASGRELKELANFNAVSPGYFKTLGTALVRGRDISDQDTAGSTRVAVVNEMFVRKLLGTADPLGRVFRVQSEPGTPEPMYEIVGVVKDTKYGDLREDFLPIAYPARAQDPKPDPNSTITVRSAMLPSAMLPEVERVVTRVNPSIGIQFSVFKTQIRDSLQRELLMASLSGFFGILAAILATIGLYGVISYMVVRRRGEIGIRIALGADRLRVLALVMREAVMLLVAGLAVGGVLVWLSGRAARSLLFGLTPQDPSSLFMAALLLAAAAAAASYIPAFRASRVDPLEALREE